MLPFVYNRWFRLHCSVEFSRLCYGGLMFSTYGHTNFRKAAIIKWFFSLGPMNVSSIPDTSDDSLVPLIISAESLLSALQDVRQNNSQLQSG